MLDRVLLFCLPVLTLLSPLLHGYHHLKLPLGVQFFMVAGCIVAVALALGAALAWLRSRDQERPWQILQAMLLGALLLLAIDLWTYDLDGSLLLLRLPSVAALWASVAAIFWLLRRQLPKILVVGAVAALLSTNLSLRSAPFAARAEVASGFDKPAPVLYIILDEMIGPEGIPRKMAGGEAAYQAVLRLFDKHGFRLFGRAFSRHSMTFRSIPNTLNFDRTDNSWGMYLQHSTNEVVQSVLLENLAQTSPLVVYQTKHVDFCNQVPTRCETLPSFDAEGEWVAYLGLGPAGSLSMLKQAMYGSLLARAGTQLTAMVLGLKLDEQIPKYFDAYAFPTWFDKFAADVVGSGGGSNYFAHILSPHAPYLLDPTCAPKPGREFSYYLNEVHGLAGDALDDARARQYSAYFEQVTCLLGKLDMLFGRLAEVPGFANAVVVVHGDHGSRISGGRFAETVTDRDLVDNNATLYAIRSPSIAAGYDLRRVSVQALTAEYFGGAERPADGDDLSIVIDSAVGEEAVIRQMPIF